MTTLDKLVGLIADTSSSLPADVEAALKRSLMRETRGSPAAAILDAIIENVHLARKTRQPLCQDTGMPTFYVDAGLRRKVTPDLLKRAVAAATERGYLRRNCIDALTGASHDDNCADGAPIVHYVDWERPNRVTLLLKGGGCENMSRQYSLPDETLKAGRDLAGVETCILDAVRAARGFGCAPGMLGVCIGGDRASAYEVAKEQFLRQLSPAGESTVRQLCMLEKSIVKKANSLGIGPMGLGGATTLLGVRAAARPRVPASYFVTVSYMCWACRRRSVVL
ncbi:MAG: fumarate hydratase [Kiritimatiellae bacterium]|nr:fumarate hydratase [Kiritimatiellia bacterium]